MIGCFLVQLGGHHRGHPIRGYAVIDIEDAHLVAGVRWSVLKSGYAYRRVAKRDNVFLHRLILGLDREDPREGDHINGDKLDNRRSNLRACTHAENTQNVSPRANRTSAFRGVCWSRDREKWRASVTANFRHVHLGYFDDELVAAEAARQARIRLMPQTNEARHPLPAREQVIPVGVRA